MIVLLFSTRNGMATLPVMLARLAALAIPPGGLRMLAVDNGSSDGSGDLLRQWGKRLPLEVIQYPIAGKNQALNRALDHLRRSRSQPELVVITDDDILPEKDWLVRLAQAAREQPDADLFGGRIVPQWPGPLPHWLAQLEDYFGVLFAITAHRGGCCTGHDIWGPNMAVRGALFAAGARFDPHVGPNGQACFAMGSETEFLLRMERAGHRGYFVANACVGHQIKPGQITRQSVLERAFRHGLGKGGRALDPAPRAELVSGLLRDAGSALASELKALLALLRIWPRHRLRVLYGRQWQRGYVTGRIESLWPQLAGSAIRKVRKGRNIPAVPSR